MFKDIIIIIILIACVALPFIFKNESVNTPTQAEVLKMQYCHDMKGNC